MKYIKLFFAITLLFTLCSAFSLKKGESKPVYAFGVSASFNDSVVYYTDIQLLDSVELPKDGFLPNRDLYSYQLKNFIENGGMQQNTTSMIYFSEKKSQLEKEQTSLLGKYKKSKTVILQLIDADKFRFVKAHKE